MPTTKLSNWQKILNLNKFKKNWQKKCQNFKLELPIVNFHYFI